MARGRSSPGRGPWTSWQLITIVWGVLLIIGGGSIFSQGISIVIAGIIVYYLNQPHVKSAFGKAAA